MSATASLITGVSIVYSTICSCADQRKHQSSASLAFVRGIHRWPVNSHHKGPVTRKMLPFDDVIMFKWKFWLVVLKLNSAIDGWGIYCEIACIGSSLDFTNGKSKLIPVMVWCRQATRHYLKQCWPRFLSIYIVTRSQLFWTTFINFNKLLSYRTFEHLTRFNALLSW